MLKARLQVIDPHALDDQPNNPAVLDRLRVGGVALSAAEVDNVTQLRRLRNCLQPGTAHFNHRFGLGLCRQAVAFVDRFADDELGIWTGDGAIPADQWRQLLSIDSLAARALRIATERVAPAHSDQAATVTRCPECSTETMIRPRPNAGAVCVYFGHVPTTPGK
jgi:DNA-directed RNA polymerase subunit RPC12/RpoP